jgi:DNA-binding response OmpR family regulator
MDVVISMYNLLLVEDDYSLADTLVYYLKGEGFNVLLGRNVKEAESFLDAEKIDLIILDISLPDGSGLDLCKKIRETSDIPLIFLTAMDEEFDIIRGLDLGADDYITKPFKARELLSRIKSLLRRVGKKSTPVIKINDVTIDTKQFKVYKADIELELTSLEYRLLLFLVENKGQVLTREQILNSMWDSFDKYVNDNTLTVYIKRLREKIEDDPMYPNVIKTVRGIGYIVGE